jgi:hypothetical protein
MGALRLSEQFSVVQFFCPSLAIPSMPMTMLSTTFIAAIFYEVTAITILQFDVVQCCDAAPSAHNI